LNVNGGYGIQGGRSRSDDLCGLAPVNRRSARTALFTRSNATGKDGNQRVTLYCRAGNDLAYRFPLIVEALSRLRARSCILDGEAVVCGDDAIASFDRIRYRRHDASAFLYAFDLIELNWRYARPRLASLLARATPGLCFNEHLDNDDGPLVFAHACMLGLEGIVSKRRDSPYRSGRSPRWIGPHPQGRV
jgi:bifunctional non-homologous end joining protein LigD